MLGQLGLSNTEKKKEKNTKGKRRLSFLNEVQDKGGNTRNRVTRVCVVLLQDAAAVRLLMLSPAATTAVV